MGLVHDIPKEYFTLGPVSVACDSTTPSLCRLPYSWHSRGCPNYGVKGGCPPHTKPFEYRFEPEARVVAVRFPIAEYARLRKLEHPDWTSGQLRNLRHWQGHLRSCLREYLSSVELSRQDRILLTPEGMCVNVFETCKRAGLELEWPPVNYVCCVALIAKRSE
jgi:hypothetical protein